MAALAVVAGLAPLAGGSASAQVEGLVRRAPSNVSPRLDELAARPAATTSAARENRSVGLPSRGPGSLLHQPDGTFLVNARLASVDAVSEAALVRAGARITATSPADHLVTLAIDATGIEAVAAVAGVQWLEEVLEPRVGRADLAGVASALREDGVGTSATCAAKVTSEGDTHVGAATARATYGVDGTGIKIGVLSDSYDRLGGAATDVANGELPGAGNPCGRTTPVVVQSELDSANTGGSDEGRAMAQAVHDLAPGASILVASAFNGDVDFANQIRALAAAGAKVIVDDISYFNEPVYQDGIIAKAIADVTAGGVTYFSSAANSNIILGGRNVASYEAPSYRPTACPATIPAGYQLTDCHDFDPGAGTDAGDLINLNNGGALTLKLGYNEPQYGITTDLELLLVDQSTSTVVATAVLDNIAGSRQAYELLSYTNSSGTAKTYRLVIGRFAGAAPRLKVIMQTGTGVTSVQWNASSGGDVVGPTSYGHNMMRGAGSVAAIRYSSTTAPETFSSRGPVAYCWNPVVGVTAATALPSCESDTIDIAATDGAANSFFGQLVSGVWRFYGTSQAAPHAAAVAVLQLAAQPCRTPAELLAAQRASGIAIGSFDVDAVGGGRLDASAAIGNLAPCQVPPGAPTGVSGTPGDSQVALTWSAPAATGTSAITGYRVTPSTGASAQPAQTFNSTATTQTITGLTNGTAYTFKVAAISAAGTGPDSTASPAITPVAPADPWVPFPSWGAMVDRFYLDLLGREPTASERTTRVAQLGDGTLTPGGLVTALRLDPDQVGNVDPVTRLYRAYVLRVPDKGGLTYWIRQRRVNGKKLNAISDAFATSSEFTTKYGKLSNRAFVELVYKNVLERDGEASGVAYWTSRLDRKVSTRGQVMTGFSESNEYKNKQVNEVHVSVVRILLGGSAPTLAEFNDLVAALDDGTTSVAEIAQAIIDSPAYAARITG